MTPEDAFAFEVTVANDVAGIGLDLFDSSREFGSNGRLSSLVQMDAITNFPDDPATKFLGENNTLSVIGQEVGHRWLAFLQLQRSQSAAVGGAAGARRGALELLLQLRRIGDGGQPDSGSRRRQLQDRRRRGTVQPARSVCDGPGSRHRRAADVLRREPGELSSERGADSPPRVGVTFSGTRRDVLINDVIEVMGARQPSSANSRRVFRQAFLFVVGRGGRRRRGHREDRSHSDARGSPSSRARWTVARASIPGFSAGS